MMSAPVPPREGMSNDQRHGFRRPKLQISLRTPAGPVLTNGFVDGTTYPLGLLTGTLTSMRSIFPSNSPGFCARFSGSLADPPSPIPTYRYPSGPKARLP